MQKLSDKLKLSSEQFEYLDKKYNDIFQQLLVKYDVLTPIQLKDNQAKLKNFFAELSDNITYMDLDK